MLDVLKELVSSKKFLAAVGAGLAGLLLRVSSKAGHALDPETAKQAADAITYLAVAYVVGQGVADHGKEAKKIEAQGVVSQPGLTFDLAGDSKTGASS